MAAKQVGRDTLDQMAATAAAVANPDPRTGRMVCKPW